MDAGELYGGALERTLNDCGILPEQGHAVQPTSIEHTPEGDFVRLNDPGRPDGAGIRIPWEQFADAAEDHGCRGVALADHQTATDIRYALSGNHPEGIGSSTIGAPLEPLNIDNFGYGYRGNSPFPVRDPITHQPMRFK